MSSEENKAIVVRHLKEVLEQGHVELVDSYYAPDGSDPHMDTPEQWRERILWWHKACPGFRVTLLDVMAEGDKVMANISYEITYTVPVDPPMANFPPPGKPVSWRNMNVFHIVGGKMVGQQPVMGWTDMLVEIGVIPLEKMEQNKAAVRKFVDALNRRDTALLDEICMPEVAKEWKEALPWMYTTMKDHHIELVDLVADGEGVAVKLATSGYHTGELHSLPPTGNWWTNRVYTFFRFSGGKISEVDALPDAENIIKQLGGVIQPAV